MLCECRNQIDPARASPEIIPPGGGSLWKLTLLTGTPATPDEFSLKLLKLLASEGKSLDDLQPLLAQSRTTPQDDLPSSIIHAIGELLKLLKSNKETSLVCAKAPTRPKTAHSCISKAERERWLGHSKYDWTSPIIPHPPRLGWGTHSGECDNRGQAC